MNQYTFNNRLRQVILLAVIIFLIVIVIMELSSFIPGILGAITIYILLRKQYFQLVYRKKWKKGLTAMLFMLGFLVVLAIPIYFSITLISPKVSDILSNQDKYIANIKGVAEKLHQLTGIQLISPQSMNNLVQKATAMLPKLLNSTLSIVTNIATMLFVLYYMFVNGSQMEKVLNKVIPFEKDSINILAKETRMMVRANAIGIPVISVVQGIFAALGYWIFGLPDWGMWGFVTGVFAFFPVVGTMIVWVPLAISLFTNGQTSMAIGLTIYCIVVVGNVDYLARLTLMKRMGDIHPVITILGVILGLNIFGFLGLVFGPLVLSYIIILIKIYMTEFSVSKEEKAALDAETRAAQAAQIAEANGSLTAEPEPQELNALGKLVMKILGRKNN